MQEQFKEIPPRVEYSLTELGISLSPVIRELEIWGTENVLANRLKLLARCGSDSR